MSDRIKVLLTTEGTYPFHQGGVSTWCDILVQQLKQVDFVIYSVLMDPFVTQKFKLPANTSLIKMPLWGTEEPGEHLTTPFSQTFLAKARTTRKVIREHFLPLFETMIGELIAEEKDPHKLAGVLYALHQFFAEYEYKVSFKSEEAWELYKELVLTRYQNGNSNLARPDLYCLVQSLGWVYRFMNILNTPVPKVHVTHSSAAAFCGIPCVLAKLRDKTPYLLTEHGIYLREQYLSLGKREYSSFLNTFLIRLVHSVTSLNYAFADQVSPVCSYNTRWEERFQVKRERIRVIYNGVDRRVFPEVPAVKRERPTVVTVARIDPLKDIVTLIKSAVLVKSRIPDVKFIIYGSVSVQAYYEECLALRKELEMEDVIEFAGFTSNMSAAYASGDVIALTSISEAFPYSVVEAMMSGQPCIATDVGGIREALGQTGVLVNPRDCDALAEGIVELLEHPELRRDLGQEARERALNYFTLERVLQLHLNSYLRLALVPDEEVARPVAERAVASRSERTRRQRLYAERGYAFMVSGLELDAIRHFRLAILEDADAAAAPALMAEVAQCYNRLGEYDKAFAAMEKHEALVLLQRTQSA